MKRWFSDTLFKRLFVLMWVALVASHALGFLAAHRGVPPGPHAGPGLPPMPSLPPLGSPPPHAPPGGAGPRPAPPDLWLDYTVRALAIALAAAWGARWLSAPFRRLGQAATDLDDALRHGRAPPPVDAGRGPVEARETAQVFNAVSARLQSQFAGQQLLMAAISHDLRTPLARLRLRLEQMPPGPVADRCAADIDEMDTLVGNALTLLREQHAPGDTRRVDVSSLLQAIADDALAAGQAVTFEGVAAVVDGHPAALRRAFENLVGNAVRHAGSAVVRTAPDGDTVSVTIDDDGPGIPTDRLEAVFAPFVRLEGASLAHGTGLGLHIARDLLARHGGTVRLENRPGGGLRAIVQLPAADATMSPAT